MLHDIPVSLAEDYSTFFSKNRDRSNRVLITSCIAMLIIQLAVMNIWTLEKEKQPRSHRIEVLLLPKTEVAQQISVSEKTQQRVLEEVRPPPTPNDRPKIETGALEKKLKQDDKEAPSGRELIQDVIEFSRKNQEQRAPRYQSFSTTDFPKPTVKKSLARNLVPPELFWKPGISESVGPNGQITIKHVSKSGEVRCVQRRGEEDPFEQLNAALWYPVSC